MNSAQRSAVVLLMASAAAAYKKDAHGELAESRRVEGADAPSEMRTPRPRRLMRGMIGKLLRLVSE